MASRLLLHALDNAKRVIFESVQCLHRQHRLPSSGGVLYFVGTFCKSLMLLFSEEYVVVAFSCLFSD